MAPRLEGNEGLLTRKAENPIVAGQQVGIGVHVGMGECSFLCLLESRK